jgi:hypothetical protein
VPVTAANGQERAQIQALAAAVQEATGEPFELLYVTSTSRRAPEAVAAEHGTWGRWSSKRRKKGFRSPAALLGGRAELRPDELLPSLGETWSGFLRPSLRSTMSVCRSDAQPKRRTASKSLACSKQPLTTKSSSTRTEGHNDGSGRKKSAT